MVRSMLSRAALAALAAALVLSLAAPWAIAQGIGDEGVYTMREEYRMVINEVGDAEITDTITYDEDWFAEYGFLFEENPNLLSRRYREDSDVGEVEDFDAEIDAKESAITITFKTPGLAYNFKDRWAVYGYGQYELVDEGDDEVVLEAAWQGVNNEFTLFENMDLEQRVVIELPEGAANAAFDPATGAVEYELPYKGGAAGGNLLADNKTLFLVIFALLMAVSLILLLYLFSRRTEEPAAVAAPVAPAPPAPPAAAPGAAAEAAPRFCRKCGHPKGKPDEKFCRKCGAPHE